MSAVILYIATSSDGFIADQQGGVDWLPHPKTPDDLEVVGYNRLMERISTIIMGSNSYQQIVGFGDWTWTDKQTYVFTKQPLKPVHPSIIFQGEPKAFMQQHKLLQANGNIWLLGGAQLAQSFASNNLIDEYIITVIPIELKQRIKLELPNNQMKFIASTACMNGMIQNTYDKI